MAIRNIFVEGDDVLRKKSRVVEEVNEKIITLLDDMRDTMEDSEGVGIAAPQVGVLKRMIIVHFDPEDEGTYFEFINPELSEEEGTQEGSEGCLSLPGFIGMVKRPEKVRIKGLDRRGNMQDFYFEGFAAVVVCHEMDHLDGILYKDKASEYQRTEG